MYRMEGDGDGRFGGNDNNSLAVVGCIVGLVNGFGSEMAKLNSNEHGLGKSR